MKNHHRVGYIRLSRAGPPLEAQKKALLKAGAGIGRIKKIFVDDLPEAGAASNDRFPERTKAIQLLAPGDHLVIATPSQLGSKKSDILKALEAIGAQGAMLYVASLGRSFAWTLALAEFTALVTKDSNALVTEKMRAHRATGARSGPKPKLVEGTERWESAKADWGNPKRAPETVAKKFGVSIPTLYRRFGPKG